MSLNMNLLCQQFELFVAFCIDGTVPMSHMTVINADISISSDAAICSCN